MPLSVPSLDLLVQYMNVSDITEALDVNADEDAGSFALQMATDLMFLATGATVDPVDPQQLRIVQYGIVAMAEFFLVQNDVRRGSYSPTQSERIGSYSYTMAKDIVNGVPTKILWFDQAVTMLTGSDENLLITSTRVFEDSENLLYVDTAGRRFIFGPATIRNNLMREQYVHPELAVNEVFNRDEFGR